MSGSAQAPDSTQNARSIEQGKQLFQSCTSFYGQDEKGQTTLGAPPLAGQLLAYLQHQLEHFKSDKRGSSSRYAKQMQMMSNTLKNADNIALVNKFISTL